MGDAHAPTAPPCAPSSAKSSPRRVEQRLAFDDASHSPPHVLRAISSPPRAPKRTASPLVMPTRPQLRHAPQAARRAAHAAWSNASPSTMQATRRRCSSEAGSHHAMSCGVGKLTLTLQVGEVYVSCLVSTHLWRRRESERRRPSVAQTSQLPPRGEGARVGGDAEVTDTCWPRALLDFGIRLPP